jgi:dihydroxyacetone kinase-like predicted kinase
MRTEVLELDDRFGKEYIGKYVFQEITWAKRNRILQKHTRYNPQTGSVTATDYVAIQGETIMASLKEQPQSKPVTLEKLLGEGEEGVPIRLGELFSKTVNKLNALTVEETKNS